MEVKINFKGGTNHKIYAPVNQQACDYIRIENSVADITAEYRKPSLTSFDPAFKMAQPDEKGGTALVHQSAYVHTGKSDIILMNRWSEFIYKLLIFVIVWMVGVVNLEGSRRLFDEGRGK